MDGTGHKITVSVSVKKQLSLLVSLCTKVTWGCGPGCPQFCNTIQHNGEYYLLLCFQAELELSTAKGIYQKHIVPLY